jgi:hypothetical protein
MRSAAVYLAVTAWVCAGGSAAAGDIRAPDPLGPAGAAPAEGPVRAAMASGAMPPGRTIAAVWKQQRVQFRYAGRTSRFSCDGLREKVRAMLLDLGVRRDLRIVPLGCAQYDRMSSGDRMAASVAGFRLEIAFAAPAPANAAAKRALDGALAAGRFEKFTITSDAFRNLGVGDCEWVQEFARQLLPKLTIRDVRQDITCIPYQPSVSRFFVEGEILKTLPPEAQRTG